MNYLTITVNNVVITKKLLKMPKIFSKI